MGSKNKISSAILAGGSSSRFKQDKSLFLYKEKPLIQHVYDTISGIFSDTIIISANNYDFIEAPSFEDIIPGYGPLGGILTALHYAENHDVFITACDMPRININFINYMVKNRSSNGIYIPSYGGYYQPLHAIYDKSCIGPIKNLINKGKMKVDLLVQDVPSQFVTEDEIIQFDSPERMFFNINYPEDLLVLK